MHYIEVAPTKIVRIGSNTFTYTSKNALSIGTIVEIEVGKKTHIGVVMASVTKKPSYSVKPIIRTLYDQPLPNALIETVRWMSDYYKTPLSACLQTILPQGITKKRRDNHTIQSANSADRTQFVLNKDQADALKELAELSGTILLHGVTGAGKTAVYIEHAKKVIKRGQSVIVLVPEISLTSQLVSEFSGFFPDILVTHSRQTEAERHRTWEAALTSTTPRVVIGPRSALFLPLSNVGFIVVDECHEPSFIQEKSPRYSALRVASKYADFSNSLTLFGSATPLVSDYFLADTHSRVVHLPKRARENAAAPTISIIDMTKRNEFRQHRFLSDKLICELNVTFEQGKQALIFHNRRGSASTTLCENCGWQAGCPRCILPLTLHSDTHHLRCHVCGITHTVPTSCPVCSHADIVHKGIGTKQIEAELKKLFPSQNILRFDGDTPLVDTVAERYDELKNGSIDLIIGTQVIAKGLDLPHLQTVGVIQADAGLSLPDYSSPERTFQLLSQVIGRVGRNEHASSVVIQSYQPTHPVITNGVAQDYTAFYKRSIQERRRAHFPPDRFILKLMCIYKTEAGAIKAAKSMMRQLDSVKKPDVEILGPTPAFYERVGNTYRWQLVAKSATRRHLLDVLDHLPSSHWQYELDPISLL